MKKYKFKENISFDNYEFICNKIYDNILEGSNINLINFREDLYNILTYQLRVENVIWYILKKIIKDKLLTKEEVFNILFKLDDFFLYYNKNYRPIYHLENIMLYINIIINLKNSS